MENLDGSCVCEKLRSLRSAEVYNDEVTICRRTRSECAKTDACLNVKEVPIFISLSALEGWFRLAELYSLFLAYLSR